MNLDKLIDQFIGEEKPLQYQVGVYEVISGYNKALQDLKSRKQELVDGIVGIIENFDIKYGLRGEPITNPLMKLEDVKNFIIKELKVK